MFKYTSCQVHRGMIDGICVVCNGLPDRCVFKQTSLHTTFTPFAVNLGAYPPQEMDTMNLIDKALNSNRKKISKKIKQDMEDSKTKDRKEKATIMKRNAVALKSAKLKDYQNKLTICFAGDEFSTYTLKDDPDSVMYKLTLRGPKIIDKVTAFMKDKNMLLPLRISRFNEVPCIEFYAKFLDDTKAEMFTIITDEGVFKIQSSYIKFNHISCSVSQAFDKTYLVPIETLKNWRSWDKKTVSDKYPPSK